MGKILGGFTELENQIHMNGKYSFLFSLRDNLKFVKVMEYKLCSNCIGSVWRYGSLICFGDGDL